MARAPTNLRVMSSLVASWLWFVGRQNLRVQGRVVANNGQCRRKLELASGAIDLEPRIDRNGDWRWLGFFGEKSDLGVFERKVIVGVNGVISIGVRGSKQI